jgi:hypothetical protein
MPTPRPAGMLCKDNKMILWEWIVLPFHLQTDRGEIMQLLNINTVFAIQEWALETIWLLQIANGLHQ